MDNQKIQQHVQTVRESIASAAAHGYDDTFHKKTIEIIEQQQREIEKLKREYEELEDQAYRWKEESGN